jgi:hypothetical protein
MGRHAICPPRRLYVSTLAGNSRNGVGTTYAFEIHGGLPDTSPVLAYGGTPSSYVTGPLSAGPDEELLAGNDTSNGQLSASYGISTFLKDSTTRTRFFVPRRNPHCEYFIVTAVATLPHEGMFVGYFCYFSGRSERAPECAKRMARVF